jgi:nucleotide-binding universal stress UspA family protein
MVHLANVLSPSEIGRVLLLTIVIPNDTWQKNVYPQQLTDAQSVLREALTASYAAGISPEALTTIATTPWTEIRRVARIHRCESLLLGLNNLSEKMVGSDLEDLINTVNCDIVVLRAKPGWQLSQVQRVLVPVAGGRVHNELRARLLASLWRMGSREVTFLQVLSKHLPEKVYKKSCRDLFRFAQDEVEGDPKIKVVYNSSVTEEIIVQSREHDLLVLGLNRLHRKRKVFGPILKRIVAETTCTVVLIAMYEGVTGANFKEQLLRTSRLKGR